MKWLLFLLLLLPVNLWAAATFDTSATSTSAGGVTSFTSSITVGGGCTNPLLIGKVGWKGGQNITGVSTSGTGGGAMTLGGTSGQVYGAPDQQVASYNKAGTSGAQTVTWTFNGLIDLGVGILESYCGVNQAAPVGTTVTDSEGYVGTPANPLVNVTVASGGMASDIATVSNDPATITVGGGQTQTYNGVDINARVGTSYKTCSGTCSMGWTTSTGDSTWGIVATPIAPATGAVATRRRAVIVQ